jgi:hypothetical protein
MRPRSSLPKKQRGWPAILEIVAHPEDKALCRDRNIMLIDKFEQTNPTSTNYLQIITDIQNKCLKAPYKYHSGIFVFNSLYPFTENGLCCTKEGAEHLERIIAKFSHDFDILIRINDHQAIEKLLSRVTWLYSATPNNIIYYIKSQLRNSRYQLINSTVLIESAGKCFGDIDDMKILFDYIIRIASTGRFTIQSMRSASRLLRYRMHTPLALTDNTAKILAQCTISIMQQASQQKNYAQKFFQGVLLLLYLLRYRIASDYFSVNNSNNLVFFHEAIDLINNAKNYFSSIRDTIKLKKSNSALQDFEDFLNQRATGSYPQAVIDLAGDED